MRILWACMIHEGDNHYLKGYIDSLKSLKKKKQISEVRFFISGKSPKCIKILSDNGYDGKYQPRPENDGFNKSFNCAVKYALVHNFDWLVTMTVRCTPQPNWLVNLQLEHFDNLDLLNHEKPVGMITTLTLSDKKRGKVFNLGHCISYSGGTFDFGNGLKKYDVINYALRNPSNIWCPCSGAAAYRVKAFKNNGIFNSTNDVLNSALFKSYNCDAIAYFIKANGYRNEINAKAVTVKTGIEESSSNNPKTLGFNVNQEISRVANILTYFSDFEATLSEYETDMNQKEQKKRQFRINDCNIEFNKSDFFVISLLAKSFKRDFLKTETIKADLIDHINRFEATKTWQKENK